MKQWQNISIVVLVFSVLILFAVFNGQVINWKHGIGSISAWHVTGFWLKLLLGVIPLVLLWKKWLYMASFGLAYFVIQWTVYNGIINWIMGISFWHIGNTSVIDKFFHDKPILFWGLQLVILILAIGMSVYAIIKKKNRSL